MLTETQRNTLRNRMNEGMTNDQSKAIRLVLGFNTDLRHSLTVTGNPDLTRYFRRRIADFIEARRLDLFTVSFNLDILNQCSDPTDPDYDLYYTFFVRLADSVMR